MSIITSILFGWILSLIAAGGYNPATFVNQPTQHGQAAAHARLK